MGSYDEARYRQEHDDASVDLFMKAVRWLEAQVHDRGWNLQTKFNKYYVCLKYGALNAMGVEWFRTKTSWFFFKMTSEQAATLQLDASLTTNYNAEWSQLYCKVTTPDDFGKLTACLEAAYERLTNKAVVS